MGLRIYGINLDHLLENDIFIRLLSVVSEEKRQRVQRFYKYEDAQRTLMGDVLTRYLICSKLRIKNQELVFRENEYGKPFLTGNHGIEYNISHAGKWVICGIDYLPVGIDVEQIKPIDISIVDRFFSEREAEAIMQKDTHEREAFFYDLWTLKESYVKAVGRGLSIPLDSFTISIDNTSQVISIATEDLLRHYYFRQYHIDSEYKVAACSLSGEFCKDVQIIDMDELCDEIVLWS